jgi:hypothetical protein
MKSILYFLVAACLLMPTVLGALNDAMLSGVTSDSSSSSEPQLFVTDRPTDYGQIVEETELNEGSNSIDGSSQMPSSGFNALWVVDDTGKMNDSLSMPLDSYARVFITPSQGGNVVVEQLSPEDQLQTYDMGVVEPFHTYRIWFYGDAAGTHQMRYNVNGGKYSNVVEFYVG